MLRAVGGSLLPYAGSFTYAALPSASSVSGYQARVTDIGVAPGILMISDGTRWIPDGPQALGRSYVAASNTATTSEETLATITCPANLLGVRGGLIIVNSWAMTSSANSKTVRARLGGIGGTVLQTVAYTTNTAAVLETAVWNRNSASSQHYRTNGNRPTDTVMAFITAGTLAIDTTTVSGLVITGQKASAGETLILEGYEVWLVP